MTRMARGRDTHLVPEEIAAEALRQFDEGSDAPSMRGLAEALGVAPSAIYHHYPSREEIVSAAVDLVWNEVVEDFGKDFPDPFTADPIEALVASGVATRRAFGRHYRLAPFMAQIPQETPMQTLTLTMLGSGFERMGLSGTQISAAFHAYSSFTVGSALFAADRRLRAERDDSAERYRSLEVPALVHLIRPDTMAALDDMVDLSSVDPERDEQLFARGLRRLMESFLTAPE